MRLNTILVSIDGDRMTTDTNRGSGTYNDIITNVNAIRAMGYKGDLIARMTCSRPCRIFEDSVHLLNTNLFDHIHWQVK